MTSIDFNNRNFLLTEKDIGDPTKLQESETQVSSRNFYLFLKLGGYIVFSYMISSTRKSQSRINSGKVVMSVEKVGLPYVGDEH